MLSDNFPHGFQDGDILTADDMNEIEGEIVGLKDQRSVDLNADWNENNVDSLHYIKNRPFYEKKTQVDYWEYTATMTDFSEESSMFTPKKQHFELKGGEVFSGTLSYEGETVQTQYTVVDLHTMSPDFPENTFGITDQNENCCIYVNMNVSLDSQGNPLIYTFEQDKILVGCRPELTIRIDGLNSSIIQYYKISKNFLPTPDFNENDEKKGEYIQNRPCFKYKVQQNFWSYTADIINEDQAYGQYFYSFIKPLPLTKDSQYTVRLFNPKGEFLGKALCEATKPSEIEPSCPDEVRMLTFNIGGINGSIATNTTALVRPTYIKDGVVLGFDPFSPDCRGYRIEIDEIPSQNTQHMPLNCNFLDIEALNKIIGTQGLFSSSNTDISIGDLAQGFYYARRHGTIHFQADIHSLENYLDINSGDFFLVTGEYTIKDILNDNTSTITKELILFRHFVENYRVVLEKDSNDGLIKLKSIYSLTSDGPKEYDRNPTGDCVLATVENTISKSDRQLSTEPDNGRIPTVKYVEDYVRTENSTKIEPRLDTLESDSSLLKARVDFLENKIFHFIEQKNYSFVKSIEQPVDSNIIIERFYGGGDEVWNRYLKAYFKTITFNNTPTQAYHLMLGFAVKEQQLIWFKREQDVDYNLVYCWCKSSEPLVSELQTAEPIKPLQIYTMKPSNDKKHLYIFDQGSKDIKDLDMMLYSTSKIVPYNEQVSRYGRQKPQKFTITGKNLVPQTHVLDYKINEITGKYEPSTGWLIKEKIPVNPNTAYTLTNTYKEENGVKVPLYFRIESDEYGHITFIGSSTSGTFTTTPLTTRVSFHTRYTDINAEQYQLEKGEQPTSYATHSEQTFIIPDNILNFEDYGIYQCYIDLRKKIYHGKTTTINVASDLSSFPDGGYYSVEPIFSFYCTDDQNRIIPNQVVFYGLIKEDK